MSAVLHNSQEKIVPPNRGKNFLNLDLESSLEEEESNLHACHILGIFFCKINRHGTLVNNTPSKMLTARVAKCEAKDQTVR